MMVTSRYGKEAPDKIRSVAAKSAKVVEVKGFSGTHQLDDTETEKSVIILGVSLSQPYFHGLYVDQMLGAISQKVQERASQICIQSNVSSDWHLVVLLSTAFDVANNSDFDTDNINSPSSLRAKESVTQQAESWIVDHTPTLGSYSDFFTYTIMSGDACLEGHNYEEILGVFNQAYESGENQEKIKSSCLGIKQTRSLARLSTQLTLTDRAFYKLIKSVVDAYVGRRINEETSDFKKKDLQKRSQWVVLREYALIFMLSLKRVPLSFSNNIPLPQANRVYFSYPFGNVGKEVCNLLRGLCSTRFSGVDNIRLPDFCSGKSKCLESTEHALSFSENDRLHVDSSPLTRENLSKLQDLLNRQEEVFLRLSEPEQASYLEGLAAFFIKHKYSFSPLVKYPGEKKFCVDLNLEDSTKISSEIITGSLSSSFTNSSCSLFLKEKKLPRSPDPSIVDSDKISLGNE